MYEQWMPKVALSLTTEEFGQLPRNPAFQYDYLRGKALITPRPRHFHGILDFSGRQVAEPNEVGSNMHIRPMASGDFGALPDIFTDAFDGVQPLGGLTRAQRLDAARVILDKTWQGNDGPWIRQASFTALDKTKKTLLGGITITLVPGGNPAESACYRWEESPGNPWNKSHSGQPHLTWIFVSPMWKGVGLGSALLHAAVTALQKLGFASLWTTFLLGNDASMLWHWRNGFTLAPFPLSRRTLRRGIRG